MLPQNTIKTFLKFNCVIYKMEKQRNIKREIKAIKKLFKNNRDPLVVKLMKFEPIFTRKSQFMIF